MAQGSLMLQIGVEQTFAGTITNLPEVWAVALHSLDGKRTIVRESAGEKSQAIWLMATVNDYEPGTMSISDHAPPSPGTSQAEIWLPASSVLFRHRTSTLPLVLRSTRYDFSVEIMLPT